MKRFTTSKKPLIIAMLACAGMSASIASAQFKVEYSSSSNTKQHTADQKSSDKNEKKKADKKTTSKSVMVIKSSDDDHEYEVKIIDGEVVYAEKDGKELDKDHAQIKDGKIIFLSDDGKQVFEILTPGLDGKKKIKEWVVQADDMDGKMKFVQSGDHTATVEWQPKVMVGIRHTEPSRALLKQLNLDGQKYRLMIDEVIDGLPAARAGIQDLDLVLSIDGSDGATADLLSKAISKKDVGDPMKFIVLRDGEKKEIVIKLEAYDGIALGNMVAPEDGFEFEFADIDEDSNWLSFSNDHMKGVIPSSTMERIKEALANQGIDGEKAEAIERQIMESLAQVEHRFPERLQRFDLDRLEQEQERVMLVEEMRHKAEDAMRQARERVLELRDGQLFVKSAEELHEQALAQLEELDFEEINQELEDHREEIEDRLEEIEDRLEEQLERMEEQIERLADMFERLMDALEEDED